MKPIIYAEEFKNIYHKDIIILDARVGKSSFDDYIEKHISGARFIDLDKDLAEITENPAFGGRHPLPSPQKFIKTLENLGVSEGNHIVIYDTMNGANAASRCWWMLRALGWEKVQVLSGGLRSAEKTGILINFGLEKYQKGKIKTRENWLLPTAKMEDVENKLNTNKAIVVDVRDAYRYKGESEPIDLVAGHIPGAINIPFTENLDAEGNFLASEIINEKYRNLIHNQSQNLIIHCGSGVTACHTILALDFAGYTIPALYVGSWSEWSRGKKPIAKG